MEKNTRPFYPLGDNVYASVQTHKQCVKVYLSSYHVSKTGRIVKRSRIGLTQKQFTQLFNLKARLCKAYDQHMTQLDLQQQQEEGQRPIDASPADNTLAIADDDKKETPSVDTAKLKKKVLK